MGWIDGWMGGLTRWNQEINTVGPADMIKPDPTGGQQAEPIERATIIIFINFSQLMLINFSQLFMFKLRTPVPGGMREATIKEDKSIMCHPHAS